MKTGTAAFILRPETQTRAGCLLAGCKNEPEVQCSLPPLPTKVFPPLKITKVVIQQGMRTPC